MGGHSFFGGGGGGGGGNRIHYSPNTVYYDRPVYVPEPVIVVGPSYYPRRTYSDTTTTTTTTVVTPVTPVYTTTTTPVYNQQQQQQQQQQQPQRESYTCGGKTIAIVFQVVLVILIAIYALVMILKVPRETTVEINLGLSETRMFDINSVWYRGFRTGSAIFSDDPQLTEDRSSNVTLFTFNSIPLLTMSDSWEYSPDLTVANNDWEYLSWYFYAGSTIEIISPVYPNMEVLILRSVAGYNRFNSGDDVTDYRVYPSTTTNGIYQTSNVTFTDDDIYFVIWWNEGLYNLQFSVEINITTMLLDTSSSIAQCSVPCHIDECYECDHVYVLQTPFVNQFTEFGSPNSMFTLHPTKLSRTWVVVLTFALPLGFMVLFFLILMKWTCEKKEYAKIVN